ncbi:solute carrier family 22 member 7-like [Haemaphysalis longicornis]
MVTSGQGTQQRTTPPVEETEHSNPEEDLSAIIGKTGPFQWTMLLYTAYGTTVFAMHAVIYAIITPRGVPHWCQLPAPPANTTATAWKELNIPRTTQDSFSGCLVYAEPVRQAPPWNDNGTLETIPCAARNFNESYGRLTIIEEWDLVCDREWLYDFLSGAFLLGSLFGLAISGLLADRVGRRPVVCVCVVLLEAVGLSVPSANSFALFATLRFFEGAFVSATSYTAYVLLVEVVELSKRALYGTFSLCGFNIGILIASVLVHMANDWRMVQLATMITSTGLLVGFGLLLESPRWLITTLRVREALRVVTLILRKNRVPAAVIEKVRRKLKVEPLQMLYQKDEESHGRPTEPPSLRQRREPAKELERLDKSVWDLLVIFTTQYKFSNLTMWLCWFSCSLTYYIIAFDVGAASIGNQSEFLFSATTPFAAYFLISRWGRRNVLVTSLAITSISCAIIAVLPRDTTFVVMLVAWFLVNVSNNVTFLYANEIYATIVRALGFNVGAAVGRVGVIVAQIFYQDFAKHTFQWRSACYAVLSVCCGASGLMIIMLPNSKECYLPEKVKAEDDIFYFSPMRYSGGKRKIDHLWGSPVGGASGTGLSGRLRLTSLFERIPMIIRGNSYAFVPDPQATVFETQRGLPTGSETTVVQQGSMARKVDSRGNQETG